LYVAFLIEWVGVSLLPNINCKPHWHAMKLTTTKIYIYEVPYTCYLSSTFFPPSTVQSRCIYEVQYTCYLSSTFFPPSTVQSRCIYEVPYTCYLSSTFFLPSRVQNLEKTLVKHANNIFCTWQSTFSRSERLVLFDSKECLHFFNLFAVN
jgi:hypothetical protein